MTARGALTKSPGPRRYALVHHARPWTANGQRRMHWAKQAALVAEWRAAFHMLAREAKVPRMARVRFEVTHYHGGGVWPDPAACAPAAKAAIDGIVDAGAIPDDGPAHVEQVAYRVVRLPEGWKRPGVTGALGIVIEEVVS